MRKLIDPLSENVAKLKSELLRARGNITWASTKLGVSKAYLMTLLRRHSLNEFARELRMQSGQSWTGRPSRKIISQDRISVSVNLRTIVP